MSNIHIEELLERAAGRDILPDSNLSEKNRTTGAGSFFVTAGEEPQGFSNMNKVKQYTTN